MGPVDRREPFAVLQCPACKWRGAAYEPVCVKFSSSLQPLPQAVTRWRVVHPCEREYWSRAPPFKD